MHTDNMSLGELYEVFIGLVERRRWLCERIRRTPSMSYWHEALTACEAMRVEVERVYLAKQDAATALSNMFHRLSA